MYDFSFLKIQKVAVWRQEKGCGPLTSLHKDCKSRVSFDMLCFPMLPRANEQTRGGCRLTWTRLSISGEHMFRISGSVQVCMCAAFTVFKCL